MTEPDLRAQVADLEHRLEAAEQAEREMRALLRRMSHDLRTPLNNVAGALELVQLNAHRPADVARWATVAVDAAARLRAMLDDLTAG